LNSKFGRFFRRLVDIFIGATVGQFISHSLEVVLLFSDVSPKVKQIEGKTLVSSSPHDEYRFSGPMPVKL
jgi:hypothetical protein